MVGKIISLHLEEVSDKASPFPLNYVFLLCVEILTEKLGQTKILREFLSKETKLELARNMPTTANLSLIARKLLLNK